MFIPFLDSLRRQGVPVSLREWLDLMAGMQAGVAAVITDVVLNLGSGVVKEKNPLSIAVMVAAFAAAYVLKVNVIAVILCAAALGTAMALLGKRGERA